jgi:hypothetical protein
MDPAEIRFIRKTFIKERSAEVFRKFVDQHGLARPCLARPATGIIMQLPILWRSSLHAPLPILQRSSLCRCQYRGAFIALLPTGNNNNIIIQASSCSCQYCGEVHCAVANIAEEFICAIASIAELS